MLFGCDVSEYQSAVFDPSYPHPVGIARWADGDYPDGKRDGNLAGLAQLPVACLYIVYRPGDTATQEARAQSVADAANRITGCVMIDVESWGGQISGDQSAPLNDLRNRLVAKLGGNPRRVWGYGNQGDWARLWPNRPPDLPMMIAGYGPPQPADPQMLGWQYTDGSPQWLSLPGYPTSSPPFGACDHNVFPQFTSPADFTAWLGLGTTPTGDDDMKLIQSPGRGIALVGGGYFRSLAAGEDVDAAVALWGAPVVGNDRQFDLWQAQALQGTVAPAQGGVDAVIARADAWGTKLAQQGAATAAAVAKPQTVAPGVDTSALSAAVTDAVKTALTGTTWKAS